MSEYDDDCNVQNAWAIKEYLRYVANYYSKETLNSYKLCPTLLFACCKKSYKVITSKDIKKWIAELQRQGIYKKSTLCLRLAGVKSFFSILHHEGYISINPAKGIKYPKRDETIPMILDNLSSLTLKEAVIHNLRDRALIELFLCAGLRTNEAVNIKKNDIIWKQNKILIRIAKRNKVRYVFYSEICGQMMNEYLKSRSDNCTYLFISKFGDKFTRQGIWFVIKNYVRTIGLDVRISTHSLRHSFAQNLSDKGMEDEDIGKLLGHYDSRYVRLYSQLSLHHRKIKYDQFNH